MPFSLMNNHEIFVSPRETNSWPHEFKKRENLLIWNLLKQWIKWQGWNSHFFCFLGCNHKRIYKGLGPSTQWELLLNKHWWGCYVSKSTLWQAFANHILILHNALCWYFYNDFKQNMEKWPVFLMASLILVIVYARNIYGF